MSDRKHSHFLTSLLPLPLACFLELLFILYSTKPVQQPFRLFLIMSVPCVTRRDELSTVVVTSEKQVFRDCLLFVFAVKQWGAIFTACSVERGVGGFI